jgi:hypothetical protein
MEPVELDIEEVLDDEVLLYVKRYENGSVYVQAQTASQQYVPQHDEVYKVRIPKPLKENHPS